MDTFLFSGVASGTEKKLGHCNFVVRTGQNLLVFSERGQKVLRKAISRFLSKRYPFAGGIHLLKKLQSNDRDLPKVFSANGYLFSKMDTFSANIPFASSYVEIKLFTSNTFLLLQTRFYFFSHYSFTFLVCESKLIHVSIFLSLVEICWSLFPGVLHPIHTA